HRKTGVRWRDERGARTRAAGRVPTVASARARRYRRQARCHRRTRARDAADRRYASAGAFARAFSDVADRDTDPTSSLKPSGATRSARGWVFPRFDSSVAILAVLAILFALFLFFSSFPRGAQPSGPATAAPSAAGAQTPNVIGKRLGDAVGILQAAGFARVAWDVGQGPGAACAVIRQDPAA